MKRFTETKKWRDTWFQDLPTKYKLFWLYILDECDEAGVWKPNMKLAQFEIGEPFEISEINRIMKDRITVLPSGYWFINKFIEFQYGKLSPNSNPHVKVISLLKKYGIDNPVFSESKGYLGTLKEQDKEQEQDKDQEKEQDQGAKKQVDIQTRIGIFRETLTEYIPKYGQKMIDDFFEYWTEPNTSGKKFRKEDQSHWSLPKRLATWSRNDNSFGGSKQRNGGGPV